ncbi:HD domain-containing phosphohydrolase [Deinococcus yavapaiensis]|uniref:PAS domain S-box-containing protein n=1 Tax=Deinococcus yavapaiensis KR-236 TaxID=694435 RepID=A0A318SL02_9DEIO|nr:HD domain-containing phosphohydrolase [Deinococcus yavapaiensis]PYE55189.1 PAS domain S-box-containing protein [Deinococcus yavapaiensis KR-236]
MTHPPQPNSLVTPPALDDPLYKVLIERSAEMYALIDEHRHVRYFNAAARCFFGDANLARLRPGQDDGISVLDLVHPDDSVRLQPTLRNLLLGVTTPLSPFRVQDGGGHWRWFEGTVVNLLNEPAVRGLLLSGHDVTERVQSEQRSKALEHFTNALTRARDTEEVVHTILHEGLEAIGARAGGVTLVSMDDESRGEVLGTVGYPERIERPFRRFSLQAAIPVADAVRTGSDLFLTVEDWNVQYPHLRHARSNGTGSNAVLSLKTEGKVIGALTLTFHEDRAFSETRRRFLGVVAAQCAQALHRAELNARLQRHERRYRKLAEFSSDILTLVDADGTIVYQSPSIERILGYTANERLGHDALEGIHADDVEEIAHLFREVCAEPRATILATYRFRHKDGRWVWLESTCTNSLHDPDVDGMIIHSRDVTPRKLAEEAVHAQLRRFQQLVALTSEFADQHSTTSIVQKALRRCLDLTEYQYGVYFPKLGDALAEPMFVGEQAERMLSYTLPLVHRHRQGVIGHASRTHEAIFLDHDVPVLTPPESLPRAVWTSLAFLPVVVKDVAQGFLAFGTNEAVKVSQETRRLLASVAEQMSRAIERNDHLHELQRSREETLRAIGLVLEYRDYETAGHTDRVVRLADRLGRALDFSPSDLEALRWGAYLHDAGKIAIPDAILLKPGKLDAHEWDVMKRHSRLGFDLLRHIPTLPRETLDIVLYHHERWDGTGYPAALSGQAIPLAARAFALVDVYDALTDKRPYKRPWTHEEALAEIERTTGTHFDPRVAEAFLHLMRQEAFQVPSADPERSTPTAEPLNDS